MQVLPAAATGAQTEVVLLAVAGAEAGGVELAGLVQAVAADVHAEAHGGRDLERLALQRAREERVQRGHVQPSGSSLAWQKRGKEQIVALFENGVTVPTRG
ncbi:hypothetical protein MASR1M6_27190 [Rubrivivax sp.]